MQIQAMSPSVAAVLPIPTAQAYENQLNELASYIGSHTNTANRQTLSLTDHHAGELYKNLSAYTQKKQNKDDGESWDAATVISPNLNRAIGYRLHNALNGDHSRDTKLQIWNNYMERHGGKKEAAKLSVEGAREHGLPEKGRYSERGW